MAKALRGVHIPHRKHTQGGEAKEIKAPAQVLIPMSMHIGAPAKPVVNVGDKVKIGDKIAEQVGFVSANIYASVSGTVKKLTEILVANGSYVPAILIESDGEMSVSESVCAPEISSREELLGAMKDCGLVGLGGAGFPTYVKFSADEEKLCNLIINGAECEPYITSDSYVMETRFEDIYYAIEKILEFFPFEKVTIAVELNKPQAIRKMQEIAERNPKISVKPLKTIYPQGAEKVLVYNVTGKQVGEGKLPIDAGCVVCNSTTMATLGAFLKTGMPLVSKCVTVDGKCVVSPQNIIAPIGTSAKELFDACGGLKEEPYKVLFGGPMMGTAVKDLDNPVTKTTNAVLALTKEETGESVGTACIRCGKCTNHCPFGINPAEIAVMYNKGELEGTLELGVNLCMECGCCSYICPARRPLVQTIRIVKSELKKRKESSK